MDDLTAFVLAGGKSTRMGSDKAFLRWGDGTLLSRALKLAGSLIESVFVVGDAEKFGSHGSIVEDVYPDHGPLGGIHAALSRTATQLNLMLAVDLPFLTQEFLEYLIAEARKSGAVVTVPRTDGGLHPLCAIYKTEFRLVAEPALREGRNKVDALFTLVKTRVIEEEELARAGLAAAMFRNLNTPQEFERAIRAGL